MSRSIRFLESDSKSDESGARLVEALKTAGADITTVSNSPDADDGRSFLFVRYVIPQWMKDLPSPRRDQVLARTVVVNAMRSSIFFPEIEDLRIAACIDNLSMMGWEKDPSWPTLSIGGVRDLVKNLDVDIAEVASTDRYAMFHFRDGIDLPRALLRFLEVVDRDLSAR
jgi:hypothetical protein